MPQHPITIELGMCRNMFDFLWRYFHINHESIATDSTPNPTSDTTQSDENDEDDEEVMEEIMVERIQRDQEEDEDEDEDEGSENDEEEDYTIDAEIVDENVSQENESPTVWFSKLKPMINHVREVSFSLVFILGTILSMDEMMIRFTGRSIDTHRTKGKQISEGYNFLSSPPTKDLL